MSSAKYDGAYIKGSEAGIGNNLRGAEAEEFFGNLLLQLNLREGEHYFKQLRVPYLSEERFRKISSSYIFFQSPSTGEKLSKEELAKRMMDFLWGIGGPNIQEDFAFREFPADQLNVKTIISVTQANPTNPGHSIENKLHQALGELYLHKVHNPNIRSILLVGGEEKAWATTNQFKKYGCSYALKVLQLFFDDVIFAWEKNLTERLKESLYCELKNHDFWLAEKKRADDIVLTSDTSNIPSDNLREEFIRKILIPICNQGITSPSQIRNQVARFMAVCSINSNAKFFKKLVNGDQIGIETDRGFNNAPEAAIALFLNWAGLKYRSEIEHRKNQVIIPDNVLYKLGFEDMHRYTDFILSAKDGLPVYVEAKSAGGGFEGGHKHITDRAREQIARSLLHRTSLSQDGALISNPQNFHWIFVLDADWNTPQIYPHKFIHVLELAGASRWFSARKLLDSHLDLDKNCDFIRYMKELCQSKT